MSTIDRRAFVIGGLAVPLAGCHNPNRMSFSSGTALPQPHFLNPGQPRPTGTTPVFVVTGPIPS
jgi:hypothetical protein